MRVIVTGGRRYYDAATFHEVMDEVRPTIVVQGGAPGADKLAREWATNHRIPCRTFNADWFKHGRKAGPLRNQQMIDAGADLVLAFPGGRGTADCVARARAAGIAVREVK